MDTGTKVISLIGDDFTIHVKEDNPIFKILSRVAGETVLVHVTTTEKSRQPSKEKEPQKELNFVKIDREKVWEKFNADFHEWSSLPKNEQPLVFTILKNHLNSFLDGEKGEATFVEHEKSIFKRGDLYLKYEPH